MSDYKTVATDALATLGTIMEVSSMIKILVFTEGEFNDVYSSANADRACAFCSGLAVGARLYGAGQCCGYVMPDDEQDMRAEQHAKEVERAMIALGKST